MPPILSPDRRICVFASKNPSKFSAGGFEREESNARIPWIARALEVDCVQCICAIRTAI